MFADYAERFDDAAASNDRNEKAIAALQKTTPSALALSLQIIAAPYSVSLEPTSTPALYLDANVGVWSCRCAPASARTFAEYMLDPANRDESGFLRLPGGSGKSQGGYFGYDSLTGPLKSQLQSIRTLSAANITEAQDLVRCLPGLLPLLQDVLRHLGSDPAAWERYLKAFHGLILSADRQVEFSWHEDVYETPWLGKRCLTAVVQCSEAVTAMRMFGFRPFVYVGEGHTSVFPSHAIHQAYPLTQEALSALSKPVVKAVFFLEPEALPPPPSEALPLVTYELCSTPSSSDAAWFSDLVDLIRDRSAREHEESGQSVPEDPTTSFVRESVLQSLMRSATCAFQGTKLGGDYGPTEYFFRREQGQLTGVVWHSWDDHSRVEDVYCYLVRSGMPKGSGTALHAEFLKQMTARHTTLESLRCPMAICRLKAETWLKSLGYQNVLASSSRGARDGDHLVLQVREALSRAQQSAAKRSKLTPAPAPVAPPPPSVVTDFETELASGLSYSLASSHADVEEFISQEWRPSEVSAGRVDLTKDFLPDCGGTKVLAEGTSPTVLVWLHDGSDATRIGFAGATVQKGRRANFVTLERFYVVPSWRRSPQSATASGSIRPSHALLRQLLLEAARNHQCSAMELGTAISQSRVHLKFFESLQCFTRDQVNDHWTGTVDIYDALLPRLGGPLSLPFAIGWACATCTFLNPDHACSCATCETARRVEDRALPLIPWVCVACTVPNEPTAFRCATCDVVRTV
jgi:hypothetical protein